MDTDESDQIISEKPNIKRKKRKKNLKNLLQVEIIGNNKIPRLVLILVILIIIILIINSNYYYYIETWINMKDEMKQKF